MLVFLKSVSHFCFSKAKILKLFKLNNEAHGKHRSNLFLLIYFIKMQ